MDFSLVNMIFTWKVIKNTHAVTLNIGFHINRIFCELKHIFEQIYGHAFTFLNEGRGGYESNSEHLGINHMQLNMSVKSM